MTLCSFDIFDTTLIRDCGMPENVFYLVATRLFPDDTQKQFAFVCWRNGIHQACIYRPNYTLDDIYLDWKAECWGDLSGEEAKECEKNTEAELLTANETVVQLIKKKRGEGNKIVFVSDMYLDGSFLKDILRREGAYEDGDGLFVSCECRARKDDGSLYKYIQDIYRPSKWTHYGDNRKSDYEIPREMGIKAVWLHEDFHPSEDGLISQAYYNPPSWQLSTLAGVSRSARLKFGNTPKAILAADFMAPSLIPYVYYVLDDARKRKVKTLYFIARDGYILMKIAEQLPHEGIELRFLFASRRSLRPAFLHHVNKDMFVHLFPDHSLKKVNVSTVLSLIEMANSKLNLDFSTITTLEEEEKILDTIFEPSFYSQWQDKFDKRSALVCQYLEQEGLLNENIALVDVGWYGSTRMMINRYRGDHGQMQCLTYYWGVQKGVLGMEYGEYRCFSLGLCLNLWQVCFMEDYFLCSPYSTTIGYELKESRVVPLFEESTDSNTVSVFETSLAVVACMTKQIVAFPMSLAVLRVWSMLTQKYLIESGERLDLSPFMKIARNDTFVVRKLSLWDVCRFVCGRTITVNDEACLSNTYGRLLTQILTMMRGMYSMASKNKEHARCMISHIGRHSLRCLFQKGFRHAVSPEKKVL